MILHQLEVALRFDLVGHIEAGVTQAGDDVPRRDKSVPAEKPQQHLAGIAAEPAARLARSSSRPTSSEDGHPARNLPKLPCSLATSWTKGALGAPTDLGAVAHDPRVLHEPVPEVVGLEGEPGGLEAEKSRFESGHFNSITLQAKPAENTRLVISASTRSSRSLSRAAGVGFGGMSRASAVGAAFALFGPGADCLERDHP